jgi:hypothetical protein
MSKAEKLEFAKSRFELYRKKLSKKGVIGERGGSDALVSTEHVEVIQPVVAPPAGPQTTKQSHHIPNEEVPKNDLVEPLSATVLAVSNLSNHSISTDKDTKRTVHDPSRLISSVPSQLPIRATSPTSALQKVAPPTSTPSTEPVLSTGSQSVQKAAEIIPPTSHLNTSTSPIKLTESISRSTSPIRLSQTPKTNAGTNTNSVTFVPVSTMVQPEVRDRATSPHKDPSSILINTVATSTDSTPTAKQVQMIDSTCQAWLEVDHQVSQTEEITKYQPVQVFTQTDEDKQIGALTTRLLLLEQEKQQLMQQLQQAMQLHTQMDILRQDNQNLKQELEKERKIVVLLSAEVEALPDMIEKYHQERMLLRKSAPVDSLKEIVVPCSECHRKPMITL